MVTNINWDDNFAIKWDDINYIYGLVTNINEHQLTHNIDMFPFKKRNDLFHYDPMISPRVVA